GAGLWYDPSLLNQTYFNGSIEPYYTVRFIEIGLPSGTLWSVTLNGSKISSTSSTIVFNETNGTYHYLVGTISGYSSSPYSGNVTISGSPKMIEVIFTQLTYPVVFNEEGLPPGTVWSVTINGKTIIDANNITFNEPNGSYSFFINNSAGFTASPQSGTVVVNGSPVIETITFVYYLYMTGTITPSNATLYINGKLIPTVNGSFNITVTPGTYEYEVTSPGYITFYGNATFNYHSQKVQTFDISLTKKLTTSPVSSYVALIIVILVVAAIAAIVARRRSKTRKL
ncbi:MAG: hypothetical protein QW302_05615, partial [Thermoplasmatales archaeon]